MATKKRSVPASRHQSGARLTFLGAAGTVTGSKTLFEACGKKILIDCGLYQGPKQLRELNWQIFPGGAEQIDAVVLTHAHIDHSGYLPCLIRDGFRGPVFCSAATEELCQIMLMDAAWLQEEDAAFANESRHSRHFPARPLFTRVDASHAMSRFQSIPDDTWSEILPGISLCLNRSGHILGSRFVSLRATDNYHSITGIFSGDLGHGESQVIKGPLQLSEADFLVLESTYGNRLHQRSRAEDELKPLINRVWDRGGILVIPAFSVGRTQEMIFLISRLKQKKLIPDVPVFLDSPMSLKVTDIYRNHKEELKPHLTVGEEGIILPELNHFKAVSSSDDSMLLCMQDDPCIIISAAGMLTGGRILHHLKRRLPNPDNMVLFCGYQAAETKGRLLQDGIQQLRIHHEEIPVEAEICSIESMSAHADQSQLLSFVRGFRHIGKIYLNHGEPEQSAALAQKIAAQTGHQATIPAAGESFDLGSGCRRAMPD